MNLSERSAYGALVAICLFFLAISLATASRYPPVWIDEVQFTDPAVNLVLHRHFSSTVWIVQRGNEFWAGNTPLYTLILAGWLEVFVVSALAVRSLNSVLMVVAIGLLWELTRRNRWISRPDLRLALCTLLLTAHGMVFSYRMGRYDVVGLVLFAAAALIWTEQKGLTRYVLLGLCGALVPWAGLQLLPATVAYCALLLGFIGWSAAPAIVAIIAGSGAGSLALYTLYKSRGVWGAFRLSTTAVGTIGQSFGTKLLSVPAAYFHDKSFTLVLAAAILLALSDRRKLLAWRENLLVFGLVAALLIPGFLAALGKFPLYYSWMVFVPLAIAVLGELQDVTAGPARRAVCAMLLVAGLIGLPPRIAAVMWNWNSMSPKTTEDFVASNLTPRDVVIADFKTYYPVKLRCKALYAPTYVQMMTPEENRTVSALLVSPQQYAMVARAVGGNWRDTGVSLESRYEPRSLVSFLRDLEEQAYKVELYRRSTSINTPPL
jgi:hypothetical protein